MNACCAHGMRNQTRLGHHRQRPGDQQQRAADEQRRAERLEQPAGETSRPSSTNSPIWASEAMPSAKPMLADRCGSVGVAEHHPAQVDRDEAGGVRQVAPRRRPARTARAWPAGRSRPAGSADAAQQLAPAEADRQPDRGAADQLEPRSHAVSHHGPHLTPVSASASAVTRRIAGASLSPLSASSEAAIRRGSGSRRRVANTAAASVELMTAASSSANPQSQSEQPDGDRGGHPDADRDADGRQGEPRPDRPPDVAPAGGQTALGQDDDQGGDAEGLGELEVLELDPERRSPRGRRPSARYSSRLGRPSRSATRSATAATSTTIGADRQGRR